MRCASWQLHAVLGLLVIASAGSAWGAALTDPSEALLASERYPVQPDAQ